MTSPDYVAMHTGNGDIKVHLWNVIPLMIRQVAMQLQLLIYVTKSKAAILFGKEAFK